MQDNHEEDSGRGGGIREGLKKFLKWLIGAPAIVGVLWKFIFVVYDNYYAFPNIKCRNESDCMNFEIEGEFRAAILRIYPQLVIRYENKVILLIHLKDYYDNEYLQFDGEGKCSLQKKNGDFVGSLQRYLQENIVKEINGSGVANIEERLFIYVESLGGVRYVNNKGNVEKQYCIIENDGVAIGYSVEDELIEDRLYEMELEVGSQLNRLEENEEITEIVQVVSEKIRSYYGG